MPPLQNGARSIQQEEAPKQQQQTRTASWIMKRPHQSAVTSDSRTVLVTGQDCQTQRPVIWEASIKIANKKDSLIHGITGVGTVLTLTTMDSVEETWKGYERIHCSDCHSEWSLYQSSTSFRPGKSWRIKQACVRENTKFECMEGNRYLALHPQTRQGKIQARAS